MPSDSECEWLWLCPWPDCEWMPPYCAPWPWMGECREDTGGRLNPPLPLAFPFAPEFEFEVPLPIFSATDEEGGDSENGVYWLL